MHYVFYLLRNTKCASRFRNLKLRCVLFYGKCNNQPQTTGGVIYNLSFRFHFVFTRYCLTETLKTDPFLINLAMKQSWENSIET